VGSEKERKGKGGPIMWKSRMAPYWYPQKTASTHIEHALGKGIRRCGISIKQDKKGGGCWGEMGRGGRDLAGIDVQEGRG